MSDYQIQDETEILRAIRLSNGRAYDVPKDVADELAELKRKADACEALLEACKTFAEWLRREDEGFIKAGNERDTPEGEAAWRAWYDENLRVCDLAQSQAKSAIAFAESTQATVPVTLPRALVEGLRDELRAEKQECAHWYAFSFYHSDGLSGKEYHGSCYLGFDCQNITKAEVDRAKIVAKLSPEAVLLNCSYLGFMTKDHFLAAPKP